MSNCIFSQPEMSVGPNFNRKTSKIQKLGPNFGRRYVWATDRNLFGVVIVFGVVVCFVECVAFFVELKRTHTHTRIEESPNGIPNNQHN